MKYTQVEARLSTLCNNDARFKKVKYDFTTSGGRIICRIAFYDAREHAFHVEEIDCGPKQAKVTRSAKRSVNAGRTLEQAVLDDDI